MAKKNILKDNNTEKKTSSKEKGNKTQMVKQLVSKVDKRKFRSISGALMISFSFLFLVAFFSYAFTWKNDQSLILDKGFFEFIFSTEGEVLNRLGKFGAWMSHFFIYRGFGVAAFSICFLLFIFGVRIFMNIKLLPLRKSFLVAITATVWFSLFFGMFSNNINFLGGTFGFFAYNWLSLTFGNFGAVLINFILLFVFIVVLFNPDFNAIFKRLKLKFSKENQIEDFNSESIDNTQNNYSETSYKEADVEQKTDNIENSEEDDDEEFESEIIEDESISKSKTAEDEIELSRATNTHTDQSVTLKLEKSEENSSEDEEEEEFLVQVAEGEKELSEKEVKGKFEEFGPYDPKLDLSNYSLPPIDLLRKFDSNPSRIDKEELEANKNKIIETLSHYKIEISKIKATIGPTVTLYEIIPAPGVRISKIKNLEDDIALSLAALGIRIIAPIPGKGTIGIEVPNSKPEMVSMRSLIASEKFQNSDFELPVVMGKTITNETFAFDLTRMPHLLVAGATGQGKSVGLNAILVSLLYKKHPSQVKLVLVDPKKVELTLYNKIERHFLAKLPGEEEPIITDTSKVVNTLNSLCIEMDNRYELLKDAQVRNIKEYNDKFIARKLNPEKGHHFLPYIVVLIDEFADLIMTAGKEVEHPIARLAQLARAIGIHLIVATQRPSVNVITGMIKANFPARIAFRVLSKIDSRTILDGSGADQLIGKGDMLISTGNDLIRLQCGFVDTPEVEEICDFIGNQRAYPDAYLLPEYDGDNDGGGSDIDDIDELDANFSEAARIVVIHQQGSASLLQRKLKLGYNRAGRIVDQLEAHNIIGPFKGSKAREVLISDEIALEEYLSSKGII